MGISRGAAEMTTTSSMIAASCRPLCRSSLCPPWLQSALADIEQRVQSLAASLPDEESSHSFAERAEHYYQKRPQLVALLQDLHRHYLQLADRYSQSFLRSHRRNLSSATATSDCGNDDIEGLPDFSSTVSEAESAVSFAFIATGSAVSAQKGCDLDLLVAELVLATVEREILAADITDMEKRRSESARKIELQGSLLEVLESERLVLLGENARLSQQAAAVEEETAAIAAELGYMRRKAAEMAKLVLKLREEHRVCMLGRKIEGLQAQIYSLERRNRECFDAMAVWEKERIARAAEMDLLRAENQKLVNASAAAKATVTAMRGGRGWWWDWVVAAAAGGGQNGRKEKKVAASWNCFC